MDKIRLFFALLVSKLVLIMIKAFGKGKGTSFPGWIALKICESVIKQGSLKVNKGIILVTGTNGKTTTNNMLAAILEGSGYSVLTNREGANLINGVATVFSTELDLFGRRTFDYACLEVDEATFPHVASQVNACCVVVTNFFRDQLDRFGELDKTVSLVRDALKNMDEVKLVLNGDDPLVAQLGRSTGQPAIYYGLAENDNSIFTGTTAREGKFCPFCGQELIYNYFQYSQLGDYKCPGCAFSRPAPDVEGISPVSDEVSIACRVKFNQGSTINLTIPVYGVYNLYNALAAFSASLLLGLEPQHSADQLLGYKPATGRMETFKYHEKPVVLHLVKNPTGFNEGLRGLLNIADRTMDVMIAINDNDADGTDISWLWDVEFEMLEEWQHKFNVFVCSGLRAEEMALRLKYAGIPVSKLLVIKDYGQALDKVLEGQASKSYIWATYTSLWPIERKLSSYAQRVQAKTKNLSHVS
jgi:UDP-N-acetylmuramyl tripeptide synthase